MKIRKDTMTMANDSLGLNLVKIFGSLSEVPLMYKDQGEALKRVTELGKSVMGSHACTLAFVDLENRLLTQIVCAGFDREFEKYLMTKRNIKLGSSQDRGYLKFDSIAKGNIIEIYGLQQDGQGVANPQIAQKYNLKAVLGYPLILEKRLIGYFSHFSSRSDRFTPDEKDLLGIFAHQAVITIDRFEQYRTLERSMSILNALSQDLLSMSPHNFLKVVSEKATELLSVPTCIVWKLDEKQQKLKIAAATKDVDDDYRKIELDLNILDIRHLYSGKVFNLSDVTMPNPRYKHPDEAKARGWVSLLSAPMHIEGRLIGMLDIYTKWPRFFKNWEKEMFGAFVNQTALSIQKAEFMKEAVIQRDRQKQQERDRLIAEIQKAIDEVTSVRQIRVPVGSELNETLNLIVEKCAAATDAKTCFLRLWNKATDHLELKAFHDEISSKEDISKEKSLPTCEGIDRYVAETGVAYIYNDISLDNHYTQLYTGTELSSILSVPIKSGDEVIGTISVVSDRTGAFGEDEKQLLESIIDSVSVAIERATLIDCLLLLAEATTQSESLDILLKQLVELTRDLMRVPICLVWLLNKDRNGFTIKAFAGSESRQLDLYDLFIGNTALGVEKFFQRSEPLFFKDASEFEKHHPFRDRVKDLNWKSMLAMPLIFEDRVIGILEVYSYKKERVFTSWHRRQFKTLSVQASVAIENLTIRGRLEELNEIMQEMTETRNVDSLLDLILSRGLKLVGSSRGWISRLNYKNGELYIAASRGEPSERPRLKIGKGITGKALQDEKPIRVSDVCSREWQGIYEKFWDDTRSEMAIPILINNAEVRIGREACLGTKPIGVLNIESPAVGAFSQADEDILCSLARHAAIMIERLEFDDKLIKLYEIEKKIVGERDNDRIIQIVLNGITKIFGFEYVNISLVIPELNCIRAEYVTGISKNEAEKLESMAVYSLNSSYIQADIVRSGGIEVPDMEDKRFDVNTTKRFGLDRLISVFIPMIVASENRIIGVVEAGYHRSYRKYIYEQDIQILKSFIDHAVMALERKKSGLIDKIGHEFRNSVVGIKSNASFLQKRFIKLHGELISTKLNDILMDCEILLYQVLKLEHFLGSPVSKIERTLVHKDIIIKTINQLKPLVAESGFAMSKIVYNPADSARIVVHVDKAKLNQVVYNLLTNSIKYAENDPEKFAIRIEVDETKDDFMIKFIDCGIGIKKELAGRIFEDGFRAPEAINKHVAGSGLGLTIARHIMKEFGGDLKLANNYKPTEFHMILPKKLREAPDDTVR